jgi:hypothetical protein
MSANVKTIPHRGGASYVVLISSHALDRAFERWPGESIGISTIRAEVLDALHAGRVATTKPPHFASGATGQVLYTWTPDCRRAHVLTASARAFTVKTLLDSRPRASA